MTAEIITLRDGNDLGRLLPPPGMQNSTTLDTDTPGDNAGSFLLNKKEDKCLHQQTMKQAFVFP